MQRSATSANTTAGPLSPINMLIAGVPARDVVWFRHLKPAEQMRQLSSERGRSILQKVRAHEAAKISCQPMLAVA